jgi:trehalose/maltose hydrolase-like predicted phosphorylase
MRACGDTLRFDPVLPPEVKQLRFSVHYRGHRVEILLAEDHMSVSCRPGGTSPIRIRVGDEDRELAPGRETEFRLEPRPPVPRAG